MAGPPAEGMDLEQATKVVELKGTTNRQDLFHGILSELGYFKRGLGKLWFVKIKHVD